MSNIAEGLEYVLNQSRAERTKEAATAPAVTTTSAAPTTPLSSELKKVAQSVLAGNEEVVTVGDLQTLMKDVG